MKAVVAAFNQEKALVGAFSVITNLRMDIFEAFTPPPRTRRTIDYVDTAADDAVSSSQILCRLLCLFEDKDLVDMIQGKMWANCVDIR